jgi:hypothetical protein
VSCQDPQRRAVLLRDLAVQAAAPDADPDNAQSIVPAAFEQLRAELELAVRMLSCDFEEFTAEDKARLEVVLNGLAARAGASQEFATHCLRVEFAPEYSAAAGAS